MKKIFLLLFFFASISFAQSKLPFVVGSTVEIGTGIMNDDTEGTGIVHITPLVGAWIQGLGYLRVGYGLYNFSSKADNGDKISVKHRDFSLMLGFSILGPGPYLQGSYTRAKNLSALGDVTWHEWGVGLGTTFRLSPMASIVSELEYRFVLSHYDPVLEEKVSGSRMQLNVGFIVYVY